MILKDYSCEYYSIFIKYENYLHTYKMNMLTYFKDFKVVCRFDISVNKTSSMLFRVLILCFNNCQYQDAIFHKYIVQNIRSMFRGVSG